jgi:hypothetical protein
MDTLIAFSITVAVTAYFVRRDLRSRSKPRGK